MEYGIYSKNIVCEKTIKEGYFWIKNGSIQGILNNKPDLPIYDYRDSYVMPGIIDIHTHGYYGISFINEKEVLNQEMLQKVVSLYPQLGVTGMLCASDESAMKEIRIAMEKEYKGTQIFGINLEGLFTSRVGENSARENDTRGIDWDRVNTVIQEGGDALKIVSLAPEIQGSNQVIKKLKDLGIVVSACHTNANYKEMCQAYEDGIELMTHLGNVMTGIYHRDIGALGAGLLKEGLPCEIIADFHHLCKEMLELMFRIKPFQDFALISDSICIGGLQPGNYFIDDVYEVEITEDYIIKDKKGRFCGGYASIVEGMKNLEEGLHISKCDLAQMSSLTPAKILKLDQRKGSITIGKDADLMIIDSQWNVQKTFVQGQVVYQKECE